MKKVRQPRVYVAGPYSCKARCPGPGVSLTDMRHGLQACMVLIAEGMAPFCPWLDYLFVLMDQNSILQKNWYYEYSISFLLACDVMYIHKFRQGSKGTVKEMIVADKHGIPVINDYMKLLKWRDQWIQQQTQGSSNP